MNKKLIFMGNELAMFREWDETREPDWDLLKYPAHDAFHRFLRDLNGLYLNERPLSEHELDRENFRWIDAGASLPCVFAYERRAGDETLLSVLNFSNQFVPVKIPDGSDLLIHTGWEKYGGIVRGDEETLNCLLPFSGIMVRTSERM